VILQRGRDGPQPKTALALANEYERERGHGPDQRALASMRQVANGRTRRGKETGPLDFAALRREWEQTSCDAEFGTLRDLARQIWPARADGTPMAAQLASRGDLTHAQEHAAMAAGLAQAQESRAAWTRADLIHCIGQQLPDHAIGRDQEHAWQLLENLAGRALADAAGVFLVAAVTDSDSCGICLRSHHAGKRRLMYWQMTSHVSAAFLPAPCQRGILPGDAQAQLLPGI
jgi:hypothetical protein